MGSVALDGRAVQAMLNALHDLSRTGPLPLEYLELRQTLLDAQHQATSSSSNASSQSPSLPFVPTTARTSGSNSNAASLNISILDQDALISHGLATPAPSGYSTRQSTPMIHTQQSALLQTGVSIQSLSTDSDVLGLSDLICPLSPLSDIEGTQYRTRILLQGSQLCILF